jgi:hypothetical protein
MIPKLLYSEQGGYMTAHSGENLIFVSLASMIVRAVMIPRTQVTTKRRGGAGTRKNQCTKATIRTFTTNFSNIPWDTKCTRDLPAPAPSGARVRQQGHLCVRQEHRAARLHAGAEGIDRHRDREPARHWHWDVAEDTNLGVAEGTAHGWRAVHPGRV